MGAGMKPILLSRFSLLRKRPLDAAALTQARAAVTPILAPLELSAEALDSARRQTQGGRLFRDCAVVVHDVARGLRDQPALFPDFAISGAELAAAQADADAAEDLWRTLRYHAELAYDAYLSRQALCVDTARAVVRQVLSDSVAPLRAALPHVERIEALGQAVPILRAQTEVAARGRRAQARAAAEARALAEGVSAAPETSR